MTSDRGPPLRPRISPDEHDGDWIKRGRWDLPPTVTDLDSLRNYLSDIGMAVETFKDLDVYRAHLGKMPWLRRL